jgi:hypothetical protein
VFSGIDSGTAGGDGRLRPGERSTWCLALSCKGASAARSVVIHFEEWSGGAQVSEPEIGLRPAYASGCVAEMTETPGLSVAKWVSYRASTGKRFGGAPRTRERE